MDIIDLLQRIQRRLGLSDNAFARWLDLPQPTWMSITNRRAGRRPVSPGIRSLRKIARRIAAHFGPDAQETQQVLRLSLLVDDEPDPEAGEASAGDASADEPSEE